MLWQHRPDTGEIAEIDEGWVQFPSVAKACVLLEQNELINTRIDDANRAPASDIDVARLRLRLCGPPCVR